MRDPGDGAASARPAGSSRPLGKADVGVLIFAMVFPTLAAWLYFVRFADSALVKMLYGVGKLVQFPLPIVWVIWAQRRRVRLRPESTRGLAAGAMLGVAIAAAIAGLYLGYFRGSEFLAAMPERLEGKLRDFGLDGPLKFAAFAVFIAVAHSFLEEYYWRWFVFGELRRALPVVPAVALSSLAFMAHHVIILDAFMLPEHFWSATLIFSACVAAGGVIWCLVYERSRSLLGPWASHLVVDGAIMAIGYDQVFGLF
jgi:membrane protease YdiL (CAAX protease family)